MCFLSQRGLLYFFFKKSLFSPTNHGLLFRLFSFKTNVSPIPDSGRSVKICFHLLLCSHVGHHSKIVWFRVNVRQTFPGEEYQCRVRCWPCGTYRRRKSEKIYTEVIGEVPANLVDVWLFDQLECVTSKEGSCWVLRPCYSNYNFVPKDSGLLSQGERGA